LKINKESLKKMKKKKVKSTLTVKVLFNNLQTQKHVKVLQNLGESLTIIHKKK